MVSKIIKRTPQKTITDRRNHHRRRRNRKSPIKNAAATASAVVVASINKSIHACQRRLIKIFCTKLAPIGTPKRRSPRKKGYQALIDQNVVVRRPLFTGTYNYLPPLIPPEKKTVFLDLDETLVHSIPDPQPEKYDFVVRPIIDDQKVNFYVLKRPFVDKFLEILSEKFEIVIFTAGIEEYASLVLDRIDRKGLISHRLYRDSCKEVDGKFVKDLSGLGRDLRSVVIVDDNPNCYSFQPENAIPIPPFTDDLADGELLRLIEFFEGCDCVEDTRDAVKHYLAQENKGVLM